MADNRLFAYQQPSIDALGPNFAVKMLGAVGFTTTDPMNLEAMLSTRFEGTWLSCFGVNQYSNGFLLTKRR